MSLGSTPDKTPGDQNRQIQPSELPRQQAGWNQLVGPVHPKSNASVITAITELEQLAPALNLLPAQMNDLKTAVHGCAVYAPELSKKFTDSLNHLKALTPESLQQTCRNLGATFDFINSYQGDRKYLASSVIQPVTESLTPQLFAQITEFFSRFCPALTKGRVQNSLATAEQVLPHPEFSGAAELRQEAKFAITTRALQENWRRDYHTRILECFRSPAQSSEGYSARLDMIRERVGRNSYLDFGLHGITQIEFDAHAACIAPEERYRLFDIELTDTLSHTLTSLRSPIERQHLLELITTPSSLPLNQKLFISLMNRVRDARIGPVDLYISRLQSAVNQGCSLDLACIVLTPGDELLEDFTDIARNGSFEESHFVAARTELFHAASTFLDRHLALAGYGSVSDLKGLITTLTRGIFSRNRDEYVFGPALLEDPDSIRKFILCLKGSGLDETDAISTREDLVDVLIELAAHEHIEKVLTADPSRIDQIQGELNYRFFLDNPPFSLISTPEPAQQQFTSEIWSVFLRARDAHHGFWSNTYEFRHTPTGGRSPFDEMMHGWNADRYLLPCRDTTSFPGRGYMTQGIDITTVFNDALTDATWQEMVFKPYGPLPESIAPGNVHAIENLARSRVLYTRAFEAYQVPGNSFFHFHQVPMTLMVWNHHFDATGTRRLTLVPAAALEAIVNPYLIPLDGPVSPRALAHLDISESPPTLAAIRDKIRELKLPVGVIDVTSPSTFSGGFCNGLDPRSLPLHSWETGEDIADWFGHSHKWHVQHRADLLNTLWEAHTRIYEITTAYLNVRDILKFARGLDARDSSLRYHQPDYRGTQWEENRHRITYGAEKLKLFCEFTSECHEMEKAGQAPVLVIAPIKYNAPHPFSPFVLDGITGYAFHQWGKPFDLDIQDGEPSDQLLDWWNTYVDSALDDQQFFWYAPRLVARDNYLTQMKKYGYSR